MLVDTEETEQKEPNVPTNGAPRADSAGETVNAQESVQSSLAAETEAEDKKS